MKKLALILAIISAVLLVSCSNAEQNTPDTTDVNTKVTDPVAHDTTDIITEVPETSASKPTPPEEEHDKLFELFSLNAGQIREKYGEITTDFYAYGGTPVCSLKDYAGVLCFFFDGSLDTPITDDLTPDWLALVSSYPYTFHGIEIGKSINELSTDLTWKTAEYHVLGSHCLVSELDGYEIRVHLDITGCDLPTLDEANATEDEYSEWENNFAKSPCGTVLGIRINKIK